MDLYHNQEVKMTSIAKKLKISTFKVSTCASYFAQNGSLPYLDKIKGPRDWPPLNDIEGFLEERYIRNDEIAPDWLTFYQKFCDKFHR